MKIFPRFILLCLATMQGVCADPQGDGVFASSSEKKTGTALLLQPKKMKRRPSAPPPSPTSEVPNADELLSLELSFKCAASEPGARVSSKALSDQHPTAFGFYEQRAKLFWNCMQSHGIYRASHPTSAFAISGKQRKGSFFGEGAYSMPQETNGLDEFLCNCTNEQFVDANFETHLSLGWLSFLGRDDSMPGLDEGKKEFVKLVEEHVLSRERQFLESYCGDLFPWEAESQLAQVDFEEYEIRRAEKGPSKQLCDQWKKEEIIALATAVCSCAVQGFSVSFSHPQY